MAGFYWVSGNANYSVGDLRLGEKIIRFDVLRTPSTPPPTLPLDTNTNPDNITNNITNTNTTSTNTDTKTNTDTNTNSTALLTLTVLTD